MGGGEVSPNGDLLPFSAVVGQDEAKLALLLTACDRRIGGVLLRGDKGSAKSTLARGLAALLPGGAPFVDLPLGATEARVVGPLDLTAAWTGGEKRFQPGLLAAADGGVLYVDEINLLPDHLVDVLLDVAASGINRVEREGVSHVHASRFLLIGSMNPEEGRSAATAARPLRVGRGYAYPGDPRGAGRGGEAETGIDDASQDQLLSRFAPVEAELAARLSAARPAILPDEMVTAVAALCGSVGAEGLRADLTICRAAAALAGWEGRPTVEAGDIRRVAPLALAHRARRDPFEPSTLDRQGLSDAIGRTSSDRSPMAPPPTTLEDECREAGDAPGPDKPSADPGAATAPTLAGARDRRQTSPAAGRRTNAVSSRGRLVGDRSPDGPIGSVAVGATVAPGGSTPGGERAPSRREGRIARAGGRSA